MTSIAPLLTIGGVTAEEIAERLREQAGDGPAEKFIRLVIDQPDEHRAIKNAIAERRADVRDQISHRNREITRLSEGTVAREKRQQIEPRIKELARERDRLRPQDEALSEKLRVARARISGATELAAALRDGVGGKQVVRAKVPAVPKGWDEDITQSERISLLGRIAEAEAAPNTPDALRAAISAALHAQADKAGVSVNLRTRDGDPANLAQHFRIGINGRMLVGDAGADFVVWLLRDFIEERLLEMVPDEIPGALTDAQRDKRLSELRTELLRIERIEEALHERAEAEGRQVQRRPDADWRAVLGVELVEVR